MEGVGRHPWQALIAVCVMLIAVWGGTWLVDTVHNPYKFAGFITALFVFIFGIVLFPEGDKKDNDDTLVI